MRVRAARVGINDGLDMARSLCAGITAGVRVIICECVRSHCAVMVYDFAAAFLSLKSSRFYYS